MLSDNVAGERKYLTGWRRRWNWCPADSQSRKSPEAGGGIGSKMLSGMGMTHASGFSTDYHTKIKTRAGLCSCFTTGYSLSWQERKDHFLSMTAKDQAGEENQPLFSFIAGLLERLSPSPPRQSIHSSNSCLLSVFHVSEGQVSKTGLIPIWGSSVRYNLASSLSLSQQSTSLT